MAKGKTAGRKAASGEFTHDSDAKLVQSLGGGGWCRIFVRGKSKHLVTDSEEFWQFVAEHPHAERIEAEVRVLQTKAGRDSKWHDVVARFDRESQ